MHSHIAQINFRLQHRVAERLRIHAQDSLQRCLQSITQLHAILLYLRCGGPRLSHQQHCGVAHVPQKTSHTCTALLVKVLHHLHKGADFQGSGPSTDATG